MSTTALKKNRSTAYYINSIISVCIMLFFRFIPAAEPLTPVGVNILGILIGVIYAWCTVELVWPSFLALILVGLSGYTTVNNAFSSAIGNGTVLFILFLFIFSGVLTYTKAANSIAQRIISIKAAEGKPWVLTLLIMVAAFVPAIIIGGIPALIIVWNIIFAISEEVGMEKGSKWPMIMVFLTVVISSFGHNVLPFQVSHAGTFAALTALDPAYTLPYAQFILITLVFSILAIAAFWLVTRHLVKPDVEKLREYRNTKTIEPFNAEQKLALGMFAALLVILMIPSVFRNTGFGNFFGKFGNTGAVAIVLGIGLLFRKDGKQILNFNAFASAGVPWGVLIMMATAIFISGTFSSEATGINDFISNLITPVFSGSSPYVFAVILMLAGLILTNFINNAVVAYILVPILYSFSDAMGPTLTMATMIMFMCLVNMAFFLPSGSTSAALLHGQKEWIKSKEIFKYSAVSVVIIFVLAVITFLFAMAIL